MVKIAIMVFPGTNCDKDLEQALKQYFPCDITFLWHTEYFTDSYDIYFLPGGFSYGDYIRSGAIAKIAPSIQSLKKVQENGKIIIGICNGFQILTEAAFLPGILIQNSYLNHICHWVELTTPYNNLLHLPAEFFLPISHSHGNFLCTSDQLKSILDNRQILFQYKNNPNGSVHDIAGIMSQSGKILGIMPHPERAMLANCDQHITQCLFGKLFFEAVFKLL